MPVGLRGCLWFVYNAAVHYSSYGIAIVHCGSSGRAGLIIGCCRET